MKQTRVFEDITLHWCNPHRNWWVTNCPDCMVDENEDDIKRQGRDEVVHWLKENIQFIPIFWPNNINGVLDRNKFRAKLKEWGYETD